MAKSVPVFGMRPPPSELAPLKTSKLLVSPLLSNYDDTTKNTPLDHKFAGKSLLFRFPANSNFRYLFDSVISIFFKIAPFFKEILFFEPSTVLDTTEFERFNFT